MKLNPNTFFSGLQSSHNNNWRRAFYAVAELHDPECVLQVKHAESKKELLIERKIRMPSMCMRVDPYNLKISFDRRACQGDQEIRQANEFCLGSFLVVKGE